VFDDDDKKLSEEMLVMDVTTRNKVMNSLDKSSEFPWLNKLNHIINVLIWQNIFTSNKNLNELKF
jgi:hypothetical protein